jgi:MarR family transcriptional regulator, temperature-dependent positive regulator of motility
MAKSDENGAAPASVRLDRSPSHLLHRALQHALDIYAEEVGDGALTQRQFAVLAAVEANEGLTQTELVRATGIDRSTLADLVARMITKGLLGRRRSAVDARANTVTLTETGRAALAEASPRVAAADARILALLPGKARDVFLKTLGALSAAAEAGEPSPEPEAAAVEPDSKKKRKKDSKPGKAEKAAKAEKKQKKKAKKAAAKAEPPAPAS